MASLGGRIYPQRELARLFEERGSGEIGRRTGFRFQRSKGRVGSSPTFRTVRDQVFREAGLIFFCICSLTASLRATEESAGYKIGAVAT